MCARRIWDSKQKCGKEDPFTSVAIGWLRASHRKLDASCSKPWRPYHSHDEKLPLKPGEKVKCDVEIWPTSIVVSAGYRLGLSVRGRDYVAPFAQPHPIYDKGRQSPNGVGILFHNDGDDRPIAIFGGTVTLHTGPDHSALYPAADHSGQVLSKTQALSAYYGAIRGGQARRNGAVESLCQGMQGKMGRREHIGIGKALLFVHWRR
jgi:hypothetical protein